MAGSCHHYQIGRVIVSTVTVAVMYQFVWPKPSPCLNRCNVPVVVHTTDSIRERVINVDEIEIPVGLLDPDHDRLVVGQFNHALR